MALPCLQSYFPPSLHYPRFAYAPLMNPIRRLIASDIPFARDDAHRMLPTMIACLTGFAALLLAVAICLSSALASQSNQVVGMVQVELPRSKAADENFMSTVKAELDRTAGVESVTVIGERQMEGLLKPWLGDDFALADLPLPVMLDVKTAVKGRESAVDVVGLRKALAKIDTNIRIEDRGPWVNHMVRAMTLLQSLAVIVAVLLVACVVAMIVLVARTSLRLHFKTVSLLHMFGATDEYILRQFQWNNAWLAARGALGGVIFAGLIFAFAVVLTARWQSPVIPQIEVSIAHPLLFVALPLVTALVALFSTRMTVKSMLGHMH